MGAVCGACPAPQEAAPLALAMWGLATTWGRWLAFLGALNPSKKHRSGLVKRKTMWPGRV